MKCYGSQLSGGVTWVTVTNPNATACPTGESMAFNQAEFDSAVAAAVAASPMNTASSTITVKDAFGTATPEQYEAMATVFGAILCALVIIWGVKQIHAFFQNTAEF